MDSQVLVRAIIYFSSLGLNTDCESTFFSHEGYKTDQIGLKQRRRTTLLALRRSCTVPTGLLLLGPLLSTHCTTTFQNGNGTNDVAVNGVNGDYVEELVKASGSNRTKIGKKVYKVVLTGGPCGGKTTCQTRLCTFFENLGWKVLRVPETATVLLGGGIKFSELTEEQGVDFQEELLRTMMQIESVFFDVAEKLNRDVLVICDRGTMDASAFISSEQWERILQKNGWNEIELRDTRYNQIIHMVSAANGAEEFYTLEDHAARSEGLDLARELDHKAAQAWVGHPYFDVVDNSTDFETKIYRMIEVVCSKLGVNVQDRLQQNSKKQKFLVRGPLPPNHAFPSGFQDFSIFHDYLKVSGPRMQARLRKRGQKGRWTYTYTVRKPELNNQIVEVKTALSHRDYLNMLAQKDHKHMTVCKTRRCFLHNDQYFQLDIYKQPSHPRCKGLILLETYSTVSGNELYNRLPLFLNIVKEVTGDASYSMFNLSLKDSWHNNQHFCKSLSCQATDSNGSECTSETNLSVSHSVKSKFTDFVYSEIDALLKCNKPGPRSFSQVIPIL
ncbi:unnamed protein product [Allacma fusca]|uniref:NadR/Ttd14 AAA domain-containing protein n=1 Tax=Allacma fusca TaxID=39272 RepID=A0A8J2NX63_9HEXA|nr:unnamed protein product [Allacma fusca]